MRLPFHIIQLLKEKSRNDLRLPSDCEFLALDIESKTGEHIGVNTVKRLLGLITDERQPRISTLDVIARYLGFYNWDVLSTCASCSNSSFDSSAEEIRVGELSIGNYVQINYLPDRQVEMEYLGANRFRVRKSINSKLYEGDELIITHIVEGYPLLVCEVIREGRSMGSFTAGKAHGVHFKNL